MVHPFVLPFVFLLGVLIGVWLERRSMRRVQRALDSLDIEAMWRQWTTFPDTTRRAYGSFHSYKQHFVRDPNRSLDNPIPQPNP